MSNALEIAKPPESREAGAVVGLTSTGGFELAQRAGKLLASSTLVPKEYQNNLSNCVIALNMAARVGADPLMVMQNLVIVHGRPTWSSQFLIATVNTCGRFTALRYEFFGEQGTDGWGCRAWAVEKSTGEKLIGTDVTIAIAKKEGWYGKNGSKWQSIPQQMLMYRAGSWWCRAYAPELSMGLHTQDEVQDYIDAERQQDGSYAVESNAVIDNIASQIAAEKAQVQEVAQESVVAPVEEEPAPEVPAHNLKTQAGIKEAVAALCTLLEAAPQEERAKVYLANFGVDIVNAANRAGLASQVAKIEATGLKLPK